MKGCVILAAGNSTRMNSKLPKYLMKVAGLPLLIRNIKLLKSVGISDFIIVVNPKYKDMVKEVLRRYGIRAKLVINPYPERENGYSLFLAKDHIKEDFFVVVMADHVFSDRFIKKAVGGMGLIVDGQGLYIDREEATKVICYNGFIEDIGKNLVQYHYFDTGFFVLDRDVFKTVEKLERSHYILPMSLIVKEAKLPYYEVSGEFWMDVDTKEELKKANRYIIRLSVKSSEDGIISRFINRKISTKLSEYLINFLTPMQATLLSFALGVLSSFVAFFNPIFGAILYQISSITDGIDGEIARASLRTSKFGGYLDSILDRYVDFLFLLALATHVKELAFYPWILLAIFGSVMVSYSTERFKGEYFTSAYKIIPHLRYILGKRDERIFLTFVMVSLGFIKPLFVILAIITNLKVILTVLLIRRHSLESLKSKYREDPVFRDVVKSNR